MTDDQIEKVARAIVPLLKLHAPCGQDKDAALNHPCKTWEPYEKRCPECALHVTDRKYVAGELARAAIAAASEWQTIESAPKDGEAILIWKPDERRVGEYMMAAYWDDTQGGFVPVGGVHKQGYFSQSMGCDQGYPTHWQPLPQPPKVTP
jgi:hypothetical protein